MSRLVDYVTKVGLALLLALLAGCGGGGSSDNDDGEPKTLGQDTAFLFVERSITLDARENLEHFRRALESAENAPQDLNSPYSYHPGAQLFHRSSLSADADQWEVLSAYMGTREYDVKDLSVSPDGQRVLFAARGPDDHPSDYTWSIYEYQFSSRRIRRIIGDDDLANAGEDTSPTYAADGRIVFSSDRNAGNPRLSRPEQPGDPDDENCYKINPAESPSLLHIMSAQGQDILQLTFGHNHDTETTTLADGKIAFLRWSRSYELLPYCNLDDLNPEPASRGDFFPNGFPNGLALPEQWDNARRCSFSVSTPLGQALPSNHYTLLAIHPDTGVVEQLYETVSIHGSDEEFVYLDDLVQGQDGHLIGLLKHFYNEHRGGNVVRLEDPAAGGDASIFANAAPRSQVTDDINIYPNQLSPKGWFSAVAPYRDGSDRLLVSWSQCTIQRNGVNAFCDQGGQGQVSSEYGIWVYDPRSDSRLPVVKARRDKVYTELALAQNQPALGLPFAPVNPEFEDNLDESRLICDDPSPIDPTDPTPGDPDEPDPGDPDVPDPGDPDDPENPDPGDPDPGDPGDPDPGDPDDPNPGDPGDPDPSDNTPPVAIAGPHMNVKAGERVSLDGSASYDIDLDRLSYRWEFEDISPDSALDDRDIDGHDTPNPRFVPDAAMQIPVQVDFVFIIDGSASMQDEINQVREGMRAFVENISDPERLVDARFAVVSFEERPLNSVAPRVILEFTPSTREADVVDLVIDAFDRIDTGYLPGRPQQREAGLEAIRWVLGDPLLAGSPLPGLEFRPSARKNLILVTDEDSDGPYGGDNNGRQFEPPANIGSDSPWQREINRTVMKVNEHRAYLDLLIEPTAGPSRQQYGDPAADRTNADGRFDPRATLQLLEQSGYGQSLQAQVLRAGLVARSYEVIQANDPLFVDSFFSSKVEESFDNSMLGRYILGLTVNDGIEDSIVSQVIVRAFDGNVPPNARAGRDQTGRTGIELTLDGSASFDVDGGPAPLEYRWRFVSRPAGSTVDIVNGDQARASFIPDLAGEYHLELEVDDGAAEGPRSDVDSIIIRVSDTNAPPNADAGEHPLPLSCNTVTLDGGASSDPDGQALAYRWSIVHLPEDSELESGDIPDTAISTFTPDRDGSYVFRLDVNDEEHSSWDNVLVVVEGCAP